METGKKLYLTRTFWANVVTTLVMITAAFGFDTGLSVEAQTTLVSVLYTGVNTAMRYITKSPVQKISIIK